MDYKTATSILLNGTSLSDLAAQIPSSIPAVRQARLQPETSGFREPPQGWETAVVKLAKERIRELEKLIKALS